MYRSTRATIVAILATAAACSTLARPTQAQIPASTGGNVVGHVPVPVLGDPHSVFAASPLTPPTAALEHFDDR